MASTIPVPGEGEAKEVFISRCIETLNRSSANKYPSREQRAALCYSKWATTMKEREQARQQELEIEEA